MQLIWKRTRHFIPCALLCLYPPFFVFSRTAGLTESHHLLFASLAGLAFAGTLSLFAWCAFRKTPNPARAAGILATVIGGYSLLYGHLFSALYQGALDYFYHQREANPPDVLIKIGLHGFLLLLLIWLFLFTRRKVAALSAGIQETVARLSLVFSAPLLIMALPVELLFSSAEPTHKQVASSPSGSQTGTLPDIYHIVLDGYARQDVLEQYYGFSNSRFIESLESAGFMVSRNARANYNWTVLSLGSMLNREYINQYTSPTDGSWKVGAQLLRDNRVSKELKAKGYTYIHMASTWGASRDNDNADIVHRCGGSFMQNEYYRVLVEGSLLRLMTFLGSQDLAECHRQNFQWLGHSVDETEGPAYVFAHFILPHHPYLFDADGNILKHATLSDQFDFQQVLWSDRSSYLAQLKYVNHEVESAVARILAGRDRPAVIIIQSDHGPQLVNSEREMEAGFHHARSAIFLAVRLPQPATTELPDSAINLYRWLFNELFAESHSMLPYHYYSSPFKAPYYFFEIDLSTMNETDKEAARNPGSAVSPAE